MSDRRAPRCVLALPYAVARAVLPRAVRHRARASASPSRRSAFRPTRRSSHGALQAASTITRSSPATRSMRGPISTSILYAAFATALALLVGYPMAYAIARAPRHGAARLLLLVILPFWTSFLIRVYAWIGLLQRQRARQQDAAGAAPHPRAAAAAQQRFLGAGGPGLFLPALHGAAALRRAREARPGAARSGGRSRLPPVAGVLARDPAAVAAGRHRRRAPRLHPDVRRVRHPRSPGRAQTR